MYSKVSGWLTFSFCCPVWENACERLCVVFLQVVVEGIADRRSLGYIAVDNIQIMDGVRAEDCKGVYFNVT